MTDLLDFSITSNYSPDRKTVTITMRHNSRPVSYTVEVKAHNFEVGRIPDVMIKLLKGYEGKFMTDVANNPIPPGMIFKAANG